MEGVYVLSLEGGKYYVGMSADIGHRIEVHENCRGSSWTKKHSIEGVERIIRCDDSKYRKLIEKELTIELMEEHGWQNVRGGPWCHVNLSKPPRQVGNTNSPGGVGFEHSERLDQRSG